ncbi:MAG: hypothetical protein M0R80_14130 [Proteobacteria bacterium]|jgi:hypothetical protein|nr:hypothetical protein [Pseudomonadota bacterium]
MRYASLLFAVIALLCCAVGCDGDGGGEANSPPVFSAGWTETPTLGQGTTLVLEGFTLSDPEGDQFEATVASADPGLTIALDAAAATMELHASYDVQGSIDVTVSMADDLGAAEDYVFQVEVLPISWLSRQTWTAAEGPEAREHGSLLVDEDAGRVILITGSGYSPYMEPLEDVWSYDLASGVWTSVAPAGDAPVGGGSKRAAQIPGEPTGYLFGGYGVDGETLADLYRVDFSGEGIDFALLDQTNPPGERALHAFAYDPELDRFVLFGGIGSAIYHDTWVMTLDGDTAIWAEAETTEPPTPRYGFFSAFDQTSGRLVVYSGAQGTSAVNPAQDTWALDTRTDPMEWTLLSSGDEEGAPDGRRNGCTVHDSGAQRMFVFGGTPDAAITAPGLYALDLRPGFEAWTLLELADEPPLRSSGFGFYDPAGAESVMGFGNTTAAVYSDWSFLGY